MLPRGEQRALLLLSLLLFLSLIARITVQLLPHKTPPGMNEFEMESRALLTTFQRMDSIKLKNQQKKYIIQTGSVGPVKSPGNKHAAQSPINLNTADSLELLPLAGIGPVFAGRIIRYRNLLGGFTSINQLHEVYGLKAETIKMINMHLVIDSMDIQKLDLDSISFSGLLRHPYLNLDHVKALVRYRDFRGKIGSVQELKENEILPDSILERISPYLKFNHP